MLYEAILCGSRIFHEGKYGTGYDEYFRTYPLPLVDQPDDLDLERATELRRFANVWHSRYQATPQELLEALQRIVPDLSALRSQALLHVNLDTNSDSTRAIARIF